MSTQADDDNKYQLQPGITVGSVDVVGLVAGLNQLFRSM